MKTVDVKLDEDTVYLIEALAIEMQIEAESFSDALLHVLFRLVEEEKRLECIRRRKWYSRSYAK